MFHNVNLSKIALNLQKIPERIGKKTFEIYNNIKALLAFIGELTIVTCKTIRHPSRLQLTSTLYHIENVGLRALPIVGLISFLIGIVLVYQGSYQLKRFGAEIFTIDLLAVSAMREIGILLTAIVVAGRSGSAFTAHIGYMKLNQEIDALHVLALDPMEYIVLPRVLALFISLPLLAFYADIMALLGGGLTCIGLIGIDFDQFIHHLHLAIKPWTLWTGIIKSPVFAVVIAIIGCYEGFKVSGGAESVGTQTTKSVVKSIFLVIIIDALFSMLYAYLRI